MARILSVEKPQYVNNNINIYTKNKIGQYSKFLDKNPIFVTYYHINQALSRQDVGTGTIETELGERSPIKFNKVLQFPIYNIPELKPDVTYDETGYDIEMDCNDLIILPNTIKPRSGDYFIVSFPGIKEFLFRVNNFRYNTIQSNDYYMIDADIKRIGNDLEDQYLTGQVIEEYLTVFDNIGTEDRCFVKTTDISYVNSMADLFYKLRDYYKNAFYIRDLNSFTYQTGRFSETGRPIYRYDGYLEAFINRSHIFYDENSEESLVLTPNDVFDDRFNFVFDQSLYSAVLKNSIELLRPYSYIMTDVLMMRYSTYNIHHYFAESAKMLCYKNPVTPVSTTTTCPDCSVSGQVGSSSPVWHDLNPMPRCTPTWYINGEHEYFPHEFLSQILNKSIETDDYFQLIIFNYIHNISMQYDRQELINSLDQDEHTFYYLPMIIFIVNTLYRKYFMSENEI